MIRKMIAGLMGTVAVVCAATWWVTYHQPLEVAFCDDGNSPRFLVVGSPKNGVSIAPGAFSHAWKVDLRDGGITLFRGRAFFCGTGLKYETSARYGFQFTRAYYPDSEADGNTTLRVPFWAPVAMFGAYPLLFVVRSPGRLRRRRLRLGLCPGCGYDTRGNRSDRCPECGLFMVPNKF